MRIISFAWTTPALLAGRKTCTRREWDANYARRFKAGDLVAAYERSPRTGGKQVATIRLTADPVLEPLSAMPVTDYEAEGFAFFDEHPELLPKTKSVIWAQRFGGGVEQFVAAYANDPREEWVIRFELMSVVSKIESAYVADVKRLAEPTRRQLMIGEF